MHMYAQSCPALSLCNVGASRPQCHGMQEILVSVHAAAMHRRRAAAHPGGCRCRRHIAALTGSTVRTAMSAPGTSRTSQMAASAGATRAAGLRAETDRGCV